MIIIPSILTTSEREFKKNIKSITGAVGMVQIDLSDGQFTPNTTWAYKEPEKAQTYLNKINFELHLMVKNPLQTVKEWAGHPRLKRILFHYESISDATTIAAELKSLNRPVGIVLNPETSINVAEPVLDKLDLIMFMGVRPGFQGQKFIPQTIERIKQMRAKNNTILISVDGGVNANTIVEIERAGADIVCPGSAVFGKGNPVDNLKKLKNLIK